MNKRLHAKGAEKKPKHSAGDNEEADLDQKSRQNVKSAGAKRETNTKLPLMRIGTHHEQAGDVGAGNEQQKKYSG